MRTNNDINSDTGIGAGISMFGADGDDMDNSLRRDYFAGLAMQSYIRMQGGAVPYSTIAENSYRMADNMLAESKK